MSPEYTRVAEGEGFEPPLPLRVNMISSHAHSTGLCHPSDRDVPRPDSRHQGRPRGVSGPARKRHFSETESDDTQPGTGSQAEAVISIFRRCQRKMPVFGDGVIRFKSLR